MSSRSDKPQRSRAVSQASSIPPERLLRRQKRIKKMEIVKKLDGETAINPEAWFYLNRSADSLPDQDDATRVVHSAAPAPASAGPSVFSSASAQQSLTRRGFSAPVTHLYSMPCNLNKRCSGQVLSFPNLARSSPTQRISAAVSIAPLRRSFARIHQRSSIES